MTHMPSFPITQRWPATQPEVLQLYSYPTPNGVKISIALEELGIPYEAHLVTLADSDVKSAEFLSLNPKNKIPAIIDPNGPDGAPLALFESGAILLYLAEKTGKLLGETAADKAHVTQWLMFQMGGVGPMFGQLGFFVKFAGTEIEDPRPRERYINEAKRILAVIEKQLDGQDWIAGPFFSIADIAIAPWIKALSFLGAEEMLGLSGLPNILGYLERFNQRPSVQIGSDVPIARPADR